jgi:hypothetical protein
MSLKSSPLQVTPNRAMPYNKSVFSQGTEEILPGPRTATDLYAWAIAIDDELLAGQPVVSLWTSHLEGVRPIHGEPVWHPSGQAGKGLRKPGQFLLHCKPNRAMQGDIIRCFPLLQRAAEGLE